MPNVTQAIPDNQSNAAAADAEFPLIAKGGGCFVGIVLFLLNPLRDLWFFEDIATHEGFGTTADTYIIGFAGQLVATVILFPVASFLIIFGIGRSNEFTLLPRFDLFSWVWGTIASIAALLMLLIESDYVIYGIQYPHHLDTVLISASYITFIYIWWCCSLAHRKNNCVV